MVHLLCLKRLKSVSDNTIYTGISSNNSYTFTSRTAVKIQKRIRIFIAKRVFIQKKVCHFAAIQIQVRVRIILAQNAVRRIKEKAAADLNNHAVAIQKNARRMIVLRRNKRKEDQVEKLHQKARDDISVDTKSLALESIEPVSSWILWYGVDQEYGLRRNRRIVEKLYQRILRTKFVRLVSKYGVVYAESYPPAKDDSLDEMAAKQIEELSNPEEFVSVYFPSFDPVRFHRREAIDLCMKHNHRAILYLSSAVFMRKTVEYNIITIQCMQRQRLARAEYRKMLRVRRAVLMFQKAFRRRYERLHKAAITVTSLFRMISAKRLTKNLTREFRSASTIKGAYRCYRARCKLFDRRCVEKLSVLKYSSAVPMHGADKCLEHRSDTFWIAESNEFAEIRVELSKVENITDIWIMTSTYSASPQFISISAVMNKETGYRELVDKHELPFLKEHRWHHFELQFCNTKYFKISFFENYGDEKHISVRQIRFARSRESKLISELFQLRLCVSCHGCTMKYDFCCTSSCRE